MMTCSESLNLYETKMLELTNKYSINIENCEKKLVKAKTTLTNINMNIATLVSVCKDEKSKRHVNYAIEELFQYLQWFSINIDLQFYCGDEEYQNKINKIKQLMKLKEETEFYIKKVEEEIKEITEDYRKKSNELTNSIKDIYEDFVSNITTSLTLSGKIPDKVTKLPSEICIGNILKQNNGVFRNISSENVLRYPLMLNVRDGKNLLFNTRSFHNNEFNDKVFTAIILRYIESFPANTAKIGVINYVNNTKLLQIINAFSNSGLVFEDKVINNTRDKDRLLSYVTGIAQEISNSLSKNYCMNLHDLYDKNIKSDSFQLLFLKDVLRGTNEEGLNNILNLIETYYNSGVRIVWMDDFSEDNIKNSSNQFKEVIKRILNSCNVFKLTENGYFENNTQVEILSLADNCSNSDVYSYCLKYREYIKSTLNKSITYEDIGFGSERVFEYDDDSTISIPVAWNAPNVWNLEFNCQNKDPIANLIVGIPGTGKSHFIDAIILNGAWKYSPDELNFHLIDFKDGLASSAYVDDRCRIPHVKVVSTKNKKEEAEIILTGILNEKELRAQKFSKLGVANISAFNKKSSEKMPRLIVIIDECQHLFDDDYLSKTSEIIVREGRAMGIHLVLATQTVTTKMMRTMEFVNGRYCFQTKTDVELGELIGKEYKSRYNEIEKSTHNVFATDWNDHGKIKKIIPAFDGDKADDYINRGKYAHKICEKWSNCPVDVFDVSDLTPIKVLNIDFKNIFNNLEKLEIPIGLNYQNRSSISIHFAAKKQNSVLLIGTNENISNGVISSIIMKSVIDKTKLYYIGKYSSPVINLLLNESYDKGYVKKFSCEDYLVALNDLYHIYKERRKKLIDHHEPIIVIFDGMQNMDAFTSDEEYILNSSIIDVSNVEQESNKRLSYKERRELRALQQPIVSGEELKVFGKRTFIELLGNAYSVNIFICAYFDSIGITSTNGKLFSYNDFRILGACDYKLFFPSFDTDEIKSVMETRFKESILNGLNENLCFMSEQVQKGKKYLKLKVYDYSDLNESNLQILKKILEENYEN